MTRDLNENYEDIFKTGNSYCANSDCYIHGLYSEARDLPDEVWKAQAEFFRQRFETPDP